jgi:hypothetical protein
MPLLITTAAAFVPVEYVRTTGVSSVGINHLTAAQMLGESRPRGVRGA